MIQTLIEKKDEALSEFLTSKTDNPDSRHSNQEEMDLFEIIQLRDVSEEYFVADHQHKLPKMRTDIKKELARIIEKKTLSQFTETLQTTAKLQALHIYKPDVELNLYINTLKTNVEKVLALKMIGDQYVGMLSKSNQDLRKKVKHLFTNHEWIAALHRDANNLFDDNDDERPRGGLIGLLSSTRNLNLVSTTEKSYFYDILSSTSSLEKVATIKNILKDKWIVTGQSQFNGFPKHFSYMFSNREQRMNKIDLTLEFTPITHLDQYTRLFEQCKSNLNEMRSRLHVVSQDLLEKLIFNFFINHSEYKPASLWIIITILAGNPLNEFRILDILLTLASFDLSNAQAIEAINHHFGTKLEAEELEKRRETFLVFIAKVLEEYHKQTVPKKNGLELANYEEFVEKAYKRLGIQPFKSKLPPEALSTKNGGENYLESFLKILERMGLLGPKMDSFVRFCLNLMAKNFALDYTVENQNIEVRIFELVKLLSCDSRSGAGKRMLASIEDALQNPQIFLKFIELVQFEAEPIFQKITSKLSPVLQKIHALTKTLPAYDNTVLEQSLKEIANNAYLCQAHLIVKLLFIQLSNIAEELQSLKDTNSLDDNVASYTKMQDLISRMLDDNSLKGTFYVLSSIMMQFEKIRHSDSSISSRVKASLSHGLELTLNVYRMVRIQKEMSEKIDQIVDKAGTSLNVPKPFMRVASKCEYEPQKSYHRVSSKSEDDPSRMRSAGLEQEIDISENVKYEELFMKLCTKAKQLLQEIIPVEYENDITSKNSFFVQFPWLLSFNKKREMLYKKLDEYHDSMDLCK